MGGLFSRAVLDIDPSMSNRPVSGVMAKLWQLDELAGTPTRWAGSRGGSWDPMIGGGDS